MPDEFRKERLRDEGRGKEPMTLRMDTIGAARNATEAKQKAEEVVNDTDMMDQQVDHVGITHMTARLEE